MIPVIQFYSILLFSSTTLSSQAALVNVNDDLSPQHLIPCKKGWFNFGQKCYKVFGQTDQLSFDDAVSSCSEKGGELATIDSKELQDFLTYFLLLPERSSVLIGLHDRQSESRYMWIDGTVANYTNWAPGEPTGLRNFLEDCVEMWYWSKDGIGRWNDIPCDGKHPYMCQSDKSEQTLHPDPRFCSSEKGGGLKYFDSCYHLVNLEKSWYEAELYCQNTFDGHLVTISNFKAELFINYVTQEFEQQFWIGIKIRDRNPQRWSSGWHVSFKKWDSSITDFTEGSCGLKSNVGLWTLAPCVNEFPFICETHNKAPAPNDTFAGWSCPDLSTDWQDIDGDMCYIFEFDKLREWNEANLDCMTKGGTLAIIRSEEDSKALHPLVIDTHQGLFIGLYRSLDDRGVFQWVDGSDSDYVNWADGEPSSTSEKCTELYSDRMKWNDVTCGDKKGYICSAKKIPPSSKEILANPALNDRLKSECPGYTSEKVALGVFIFIFVISVVVGIAIYNHKIPCSSWKVLK